MLLNFVEVISERNLPYPKMYVDILRLVRQSNFFHVNKHNFVMHCYVVHVLIFVCHIL